MVIRRRNPAGQTSSAVHPKADSREGLLRSPPGLLDLWWEPLLAEPFLVMDLTWVWAT
jgi:hypothetical protein